VTNYGSRFGRRRTRAEEQLAKSKGESGFTFVYVTRVLAPHFAVVAGDDDDEACPAQPGPSPRLFSTLPQAGDTQRVERLRAD